MSGLPSENWRQKRWHLAVTGNDGWKKVGKTRLRERLSAVLRLTYLSSPPSSPPPLRASAGRISVSATPTKWLCPPPGCIYQKLQFKKIFKGIHSRVCHAQHVAVPAARLRGKDIASGIASNI